MKTKSNRTLFTFGTLYPDDVISALLGVVPDNFYTSLTGYSVFKGNYAQLPTSIKKLFESRSIDKEHFSYLFAKMDSKHGSSIEGRAYQINLTQELILDHWELYPNWYRKEDVVVRDSHGSECSAFIYTLDIEGERMDTFDRVPNNYEKVLENARATRKKVMDHFPILF